MVKNVLFRVDASATMGMGHLLRCLALAQGLVAQLPSVNIVFALRKQSEAYCHQRHDWCGELLILPDQLPVNEEPDYLRKYCQQHNIEVLVVDGYQFGQSYRHALQSNTFQLVMFDDNNDSGLLYADVVINGASNAEQLGYQQTAENAILCLGSRYRMLRQEFIQAELKLPWPQRERLTLVMGGSDPRNFSVKLLDLLQIQGFAAPITLATGGAYAYKEALQLFLYDTTLQIEHHENCQAMGQLFGQSRLVVSAAGGSQFELQSMNTPSLLLIIADNQLNATQQASSQGWCEAIDCINADRLDLVCERLQNLWANQTQLAHMHQRCLTLPLENGAANVASCILSRK